jgi:hypothetical protein
MAGGSGDSEESAPAGGFDKYVTPAREMKADFQLPFERLVLSSVRQYRRAGARHRHSSQSEAVPGIADGLLPIRKRVEGLWLLR